MTLSEPYSVEQADTATVSAGDSTGFWAEHVCRHQGTLRFRFTNPSTFRGWLAVQRYTSYQLVEFWSDGIVYSRTPTDIRHDDDASLRLLLPTTGTLHLRQDDHSVQALPGQGVVVTKARPLNFGQPQFARAWVMNLPAGAVPLDVGSGPALLDLSQGMGSVAASMINELGEQRHAVDGPAFATACDMIADLLRMCLRPGSESPSTLAAVDAAVRDYVRRHAHDPDLTPAVIARSLGWSLRQVQLALHHTGTTPSQLIRTARLDRAHRMLRDAPTNRTVANIAYGSGFRSLSAFGASFKAQFGLTPQEARTH
ncbi:helix-turn-helix domain-containing protein [Nocardia sp. NPDC049190]|uniref:helix-turn-helix domain-containing protein n=1 Tax=Nocardia sp. NPDC049190 TaxID=3155650 RepID=UPI0033F58CBB